MFSSENLIFILTKRTRRAQGDRARCLREAYQITNVGLTQSRQSIGKDWLSQICGAGSSLFFVALFCPVSEV